MILDFLEKQSNFNLKQFLEKKGITPNLIAQDDFTVGMSFLKEPILGVLNEQKDYTILYNLAKYSTPNNLVMTIKRGNYKSAGMDMVSVQLPGGLGQAFADQLRIATYAEDKKGIRL